ncbi:MAG: hypothetical protein NE328_23890 [Lentisphaeraceae bacterium]|nr:hypothetical protein [Lentisphaeraceae bacterium]
MSKAQAIELFCTGRKEEALSVFERLLEQGVEDADVFCHLGIIHENKGNYAESIDFYNKALNLKSDLVPALANLGNQLKNSGHLSLAAEKLHKAHKLDSKNSLICSNYANVLVSMAEHKKAYKEFFKSLELMAQNTNAYSNFLLSLNYTELYSAEEIFALHKKYSESIAETSKELRSYNHAKLRIAYLSGDFKRHSVAYFIEGILHFHDRNEFDIFCYSDVTKPDKITDKISNMDLTYKSITGKNDTEVHRQIKEDEIDILIDLGAHTGKRMQVLALRSAPVQITYLGYGNTTGLKNVDYRIVDYITDPADSLATETLIRLDRSFIAFCPPENPLEILDTPAIGNGFVTFGSFNNLPKLTDEVLRLWIRILRSTPNSRIVLKTKAFIDEKIKANILNKFTSRGIDNDRVSLLGFQSTLDDHLINYRNIDIALDPFPYNGTTTTCEALHMGVPLICLKGKTHISRVSASLLEHAGLDSLVAADKNKYVEKAVELANNPVLLNNLHQNIRSLMHQSQICDSKDLTLTLESVYRENAKRPAEASLL